MDTISSRFAVPPDRLRHGARVLLVVFWAIHLIIMLVRAELNMEARDGGIMASVVKRTSFALFGALLGYGLYRCLWLLREQPFVRQAVTGGGLALATACIQAVANAIVFSSGRDDFLASFLYAAMYWFWFYFCWTTAYLAFSFSLAVQEQERRAAALVVEAREAQVRALRYQINPHFLFNTLNAIVALVRDAPSKAEEMVVQLSDFFRRSLAINPLEDITLAEEVELQQLYLAIERTRFPDRLRFDVTLADSSGEAKVPALLLQPLVENAVKHGVARAETPTTIRIASRLTGPELEIVVENDARITGSSAPGESVGLANVADRLRSRFGEAASLTALPMEGRGFRNTIRIPLNR